MSSIELRGLEVSQGCWDAMCSLNLIYVKVKAIVLTKERNTINMQPVLAGKSVVAAPGALRAGSDSSQGDIEMQPWKTHPGGGCMKLIYYYFNFFLSPRPSWEERKAVALRFAEHLRGSRAACARWLQGPAEPQCWGSVPPSVPPSALSQPGRFLWGNLTLGPSTISIPPACSGAKSCQPQQAILRLWVYLS